MWLPDSFVVLFWKRIEKFHNNLCCLQILNRITLSLTLAQYIYNVAINGWEIIMDNNLLDRFEKQIEALLQNFSRLKQDNKILRERQSQLLSERDSLKEKNYGAINCIEKI